MTEQTYQLLVADDDEDFRRAVCEIFAPFFRLIEAESGDPGPHNDQSVDLDSAVRHWLDATVLAPGTIHAEAVAALERPLFAAVLRQTSGNQLRAASLLGINRNTLRKRLSDLEIDPDGFPSRS